MGGLFVPIVVATSLASVSSFYLPGVAPHSFAKDEGVELKVNKLRYLHFSLFRMINTYQR